MPSKPCLSLALWTYATRAWNKERGCDIYLKYGSYTHALDEAAIVITKDKITDSTNRIIGYKEFWRITGQLMADSVSEITTAIAALETAYVKNNQDLILLDNSLANTAHRLISADSYSGVMVRKLTYPVGTGGEYTTYRTFGIEAEADFSISGIDQNTIESSSEVVAWRGTGGPRKVVRETRTGMPVVQTVSQRTPIYVTQSGSVVGHLRHVPPNPPLFPDWEDHPERDISYSSPIQTGVIQKREFRTTWSYQFSMPGN